MELLWVVELLTRNSHHTRDDLNGLFWCTKYADCALYIYHSPYNHLLFRFPEQSNVGLINATKVNILDFIVL